MANLIVTAGPITVGGKTTVSDEVSLTGLDDITINADIDPATVTLSSDDDININSTVTADNLITVAAGTDGSGTISVTEAGSLESTAALSDINVSAGDATGNITLAGDITAVDEVNMEVFAGAIRQTSGVIRGGHLKLSALGGIDNGASGAIQTAATSFTMENTGQANILMENTHSEDVDILSMFTRGGDIEFENIDAGNVYVTGVVSSGVEPGTDGGNIYIGSSHFLTVDALVDSRAGMNGLLSITGGVTLNVAPELGAGNITLKGESLDVIITIPIVQNTEINITAERDIIAQELLQTTLSNADIILTADFDKNGVGGVQITADGRIASARDVTISGADLFLTDTVLDSISVLNDGANEQITAAGNITLQSRDSAPLEADIILDGFIRSTGGGDISLTAAGDICLGQDLTTNTGNIVMNNPVTLTSPAALSTADGLGDITFTNTIDGPFNLNLSAGEGNIVFPAAVGGVTPVAAFTVDSAGGITIANAFNAESVTLTNIGAVDINGAVTTTSGFSSIGDDFDNNGGSIAVNEGNLVINHTGEVLIGAPLVSNVGIIDLDAAGEMTLDSPISAAIGNITLDSDGLTTLTNSAFINTTTGTVELGAHRPGPFNSASEINTAGGEVHLNNAILFTDDFTVDTGANLGGTIIIAGPLDGPYDLNLNAGIGNIDISEVIGGEQPLNQIVINSTMDVTMAEAINTGAFIQTSGSGITTFNGPLTTNANLGINLDGNAFTINNTVTTTGNGAFAITHTGPLNVITAGQANQPGGDVDLNSTNGSVFVTSITTSGSDAISGSGGSAGDISLQANPDLTLGGLSQDDYLPSGLMELRGDLLALGGKGAADAADGLGGNINLGTQGRLQVPSIATITGDPTGGDLTVAGRNITMGQNDLPTAALPHLVPADHIVAPSGDIRTTATTADLNEIVEFINEIGMKIRILKHDEIVKGRAVYDDYFEIVASPEPTVYITANRFSFPILARLAQTYDRCITEQRALKGDMSDVIALLDNLDQLSGLTSWEIQQVIYRLLELVKPPNQDLEEFSPLADKT